MDIPIVYFMAQLALTTAATISSFIFLAIVYSTCFPSHVKSIFICLIIGSGTIAIGHLGMAVTEFSSGKNIYAGYGVALWCQLVNAFGLSIHPLAVFILSLDRLILAVFPHFLKFIHRFAWLISILIGLFCFGYATAFPAIIFYTRSGIFMLSTTFCVTLLTIPIACFGYFWSRKKYRRTVAVLKLNARYELSTIRELTRVVYPIAILDALLTAAAYVSVVFLPLRMITPLTHNIIYRNTLSLQSLLTTWLFLSRHRDFKRRFCSYVNTCRRGTTPANKVFIADKSDPIIAMQTAWKLRTTK